MKREVIKLFCYDNMMPSVAKRQAEKRYEGKNAK
jgi:hypothetical protein